ncbi:MAG: hypothetical protein QXD29_00750 [Thermoplasmata archaeon]
MKLLKLIMSADKLKEELALLENKVDSAETIDDIKEIVKEYIRKIREAL